MTDELTKVPLAPKIPKGLFKQWRYGRKLKVYAQVVVMARSIDVLLGSSDVATLGNSEVLAPGKPGVTISLDNALTPHEKVLDNWRIAVTVILILVLFGVVALVVFSKSAAAATPYVSLISGLAGIALGWMFANAGSTARKDRSSSGH